MHAYGPRKPRQQWVFQLALGVTLVVILWWLGIWYLFSSLLGDKDTSSDTQTWSVYTEGSTVILWGQIRPSADLKEYSHLLTTTQQETFGLKSANLDLSQRTGTVQIKGVVITIKNSIPIINVSDIIGQKIGDATNDTNDPSKNEDFYRFQESSVAFDLSMSKWFSVTKVANGDLILKDTTNTGSDQTILTLSPFTCTKWDTLKDCAALQTRFEQTQPETFISSAWITYYNLPETKTRVALFKDRVGFYVAPNKPEWTSFTSMIRFLDKSTIEDAVKEKYQDYCYDLSSRMSAITSLRLEEQQQGLWKAILAGPSSAMSPATCTILIRLGTRLSYFPQVYAGGGSGQQEVIMPNQPSSTGSVAEATTSSPTDDTPAPTSPQPNLPSNSTVGPAPTWISWALSLPSVRWYTIYFSKQWIRYGGNILETPITLGGATCIYKLDIFPRQAVEDASPSAVIYECTTKPMGDNVGQLVGQVGTMSFIFQKAGTELTDLEVYVWESQAQPQ